MTLHVFAGPSLVDSPVTGLPGVCRHPPVAHGDVYQVRLRPDDAVVIVDGVYQHTPPVRHKEILELAGSGVPVYGAASIGALRACDLAGHGITGLGTVFGWYRDGRLESDADVALVHGDGDSDFRAFTHAVASIIGAADHLVRAGRLDTGTAGTLAEVARSVHFAERSTGALLAAADAAGLGPAMQETLHALARPGGDVKRTDAETAVRFALSGRHPGAAEAAPPGRPAVAVPETSYRRMCRLQHTPATAAADGPTKREVLAYAQLFLPDFPDRHTRYVLANLRSEHPAVAEWAPAWLCRLPPEELVWRGLLSPAEPVRLTEQERATRVLVRSFRLRSGRLVYPDLPADLLADVPDLAERCARVLRLTRRAELADPCFHPADIRGPDVEDAFRTLWRADHLPTQVLDRGFRDMGDFLVQARPFFVAAKAAIAMPTVEAA